MTEAEDRIHQETGIQVHAMVLVTQLEQILEREYSSLCMDNAEDRHVLADYFATFLVMNMEQAVKRTREKYQNK